MREEDVIPTLEIRKIKDFDLICGPMATSHRTVEGRPVFDPKMPLDMEVMCDLIISKWDEKLGIKKPLEGELD